MIPALPKPKLGNVCAFTIATPDLEKSLAFYQKLGFRELFRMDFPFPWIMITDDGILIMLRKDSTPYFAQTWYPSNAAEIAAGLEAEGIVFTQKPKPTDPIQRYLIQSPDGLIVSMVGMPDGIEPPSGKTMLTMPQADYFNPEKYTNKVAGLFGELAHPVKDLEASILFWEKLGFVAISKFTSPYPWAILSDGLAIIGLHQTDSFSWPAITYFAPDMQQRIEKLKAEAVGPFTDKGSANAVLETPEKQHINLFKLGM